jgi:hypothetical protein
MRENKKEGRRKVQRFQHRGRETSRDGSIYRKSHPNTYRQAHTKEKKKTEKMGREDFPRRLREEEGKEGKRDIREDACTSAQDQVIVFSFPFIYLLLFASFLYLFSAKRVSFSGYFLFSCSLPFNFLYERTLLLSLLVGTFECNTRFFFF